MYTRDHIEIGSIVRYRNKMYIVIRRTILCAGHFMEVDLVKFTEKFSPFKRVISFYDDDIERLEIIWR
jgi:hypothetical protein